MAQQETSFSSKLYKSRKYLIEQLEHLGFDVSNFKDFSVNEIYYMMQHDSLSFMVEHKETGVKKYIVYHINKVIRPSHIYDYIEMYFNSEAILGENDELCVIVKEKLNATMKTALKNIYNEDNIFVTVRSILSLQFNILNHSLVSPHIALNKEETKAFYKKYNIKEKSQIPEISRFDPVAITIGLRPGEVCKIIRPNKTSVYSVYYRICC